MASSIARRGPRSRRSARLVVAMMSAAASAVTGRAGGAQEVGAAFLLLPASTRSMAMGGAGVAAEGAAALFDDISGLRGEGGMATLAVQRHLAGTRAATAAAAYGAGSWTAGIGVHLLDYGAIDEIVPDAASGGEIGAPTGARLAASDVALAAGFARAIGRMRFGFAARLVRQQVAEASGNALAVDAGLRLPALAGTSVSVAVQHLGGRLRLSGREAELPTLWRAGVASPAVRISEIDVRLVAEVRDGRRSSTVTVIGSEASWRLTRDVRLAGRVGVRAIRDGDEASPLSVGGALLGARVSIEYAYRGYGALGAVHRVGVSVGLGE